MTSLLEHCSPKVADNFAEIEKSSSPNKKTQIQELVDLFPEKAFNSFFSFIMRNSSKSTVDDYHRYKKRLFKKGKSKEHEIINAYRAKIIRDFSEKRS